MNENANNMIAITLQNTVAKLGPMPDKLGDKVKKILESDDLIALMALGCQLEDYQKAGEYPVEKTDEIKVTITMVIEKTISGEEADYITSDKELDGITVKEYYKTIYNSELAGIAHPNKFEILKCEVETKG